MQPIKKYFKTTGVVNYEISSWESKGFSDEEINFFFTISGISTSPKLSYINSRMRVKFEGDCLKQDKVTYNHGTIIHIFYGLYTHTISSSVTLKNCLFGSVKLTKKADIDKYKYSGYGIRFDSRGKFSHTSGEFGDNVILFGADMSSSVNANNKTKNILVLGEGITQGLDNTIIYAEKMHSINYSKTNTKFCLSFHYNREDSYLFVNGVEVIKFGAKDFETVEILYV